MKLEVSCSSLSTGENRTFFLDAGGGVVEVALGAAAPFGSFPANVEGFILSGLSGQIFSCSTASVNTSNCSFWQKSHCSAVARHTL